MEEKMKKSVTCILIGYVLFCGFALQKGKATAGTDRIIRMQCPVKTVDGVTKPDLPDDFFSMGLAFTMKYNNKNPKKADKVTIVMRVPKENEETIMTELKAKFKKCSVVGVEAMPAQVDVAVACRRMRSVA
jgi:hypothetical protein